jgi:hypothetical protein
MSFLYDDDHDDDDEFILFSELKTLEKNVFNQTINKMTQVEEIRKEKINKLKLEEDNIKAIYETQMREIEEKMFVLINTKDEDLISDEFNIELEQLESQLKNYKTKKNRDALALGLRIGDKIRFSLNNCNEWWCECIGLEKKGLFGLLKLPNENIYQGVQVYQGLQVYQGQQFTSLNKIYQLFMKTNGKKKRNIYRSKHVEWFRDGKSLGCFL